MTIAAIIAGHMNAPYGPVLDENAVWDSLRQGKLSAASEKANAILGGMFCEITPELIVSCALEAKTSVAQAHSLYQDTLAHGFVHCPMWEQAAEMLA